MKMSAMEFGQIGYFYTKNISKKEMLKNIPFPGGHPYKKTLWRKDFCMRVR